jgi:hypothetical protein
VHFSSVEVLARGRSQHFNALLQARHGSIGVGLIRPFPFRAHKSWVMASWPTFQFPPTSCIIQRDALDISRRLAPNYESLTV